MVWTGLNWLRIKYSGGFYDSETSGYINGGQFVGQSSYCHRHKKDPAP
jgi:hypothetical protein